MCGFLSGRARVAGVIRRSSTVARYPSRSRRSEARFSDRNQPPDDRRGAGSGRPRSRNIRASGPARAVGATHRCWSERGSASIRWSSSSTRRDGTHETNQPARRTQRVVHATRDASDRRPFGPLSTHCTPVTLGVWPWPSAGRLRPMARSVRTLFDRESDGATDTLAAGAATALRRGACTPEVTLRDTSNPNEPLLVRCGLRHGPPLRLSEASRDGRSASSNALSGTRPNSTASGAGQF
jgi:hypothetical protein